MTLQIRQCPNVDFNMSCDIASIPVWKFYTLQPLQELILAFQLESKIGVLFLVFTIDECRSHVGLYPHCLHGVLRFSLDRQSCSHHSVAYIPINIHGISVFDFRPVFQVKEYFFWVQFSYSTGLELSSN